MRPARISIITVLVIIWAGCTTPVPKTSRQTQEVGIIFERFVNVKGNHFGEFTITNGLEHPVWLAGYSLQSSVYEIEFLGEEWRGPLSLWCGCGTGIDLRELAPNASARFTVPIEHYKSRPEQMRIGVTCWPEKSYRKDLAKVYWSDVVNANR
jgi:hypothetical protein